jgi:hypothetical protein
MKCRVFYRPDGRVTVLHPAPKARRINEADDAFYERVFASAMTKAGLSGLDFDDMDDALLPPRAERDKWRGSKGQGVRVDGTVVTKAERRAMVEAALDQELSKPNPDAVEAIRLRRRLEKGDF